jgi:hypothetical protein
MMHLARVAILVASGWGVSSDYAQAKIIKYPRSNISASSPDNIFSIVNRDADGGPSHSLIIRKKLSKSTKVVLYYDRHIDASWAPNSKIFFVNNYGGSNTADCELINPNSLNRVSVSRALTKDNGALLHRNDDSHLYITCLSWIASDGVLVSAIGYDGPRSGSINRKFRCDVRATRMTCRTTFSGR